ncbi:hypothetical protein IJG76_02280 [Candidatus Saccharibacteria bacterium]|nr:hypothetical protein [Candidatus Saccharibacteria bacterium]
MKKLRSIEKIKKNAETVAEKSAKHVRVNFFARLKRLRLVRLQVFEWALMFTLLILLALTQLFWYRDDYSTTAYGAGGSFIEGTTDKVESLNPLFASTESEKILARLLFASLTEPDFSGHMGLGLASSVTVDNTSKIWTVTLRKDLKWSDGEPITLDDLLFTVELIQNPLVSSSYSSNLSGVKVEITENSAIFTLNNAYADFYSALNFPILPKHILENVNPAVLLESEFSMKPVGSGPFFFKASQTISSSESVYYLSPNENYYLTPPNLASFAVHTYPDEKSLASALSRGAVTGTAMLSDSSLAPSSLKLRKTALSSGIFIFMNTTTEPLNNVELRRAIQKGVNMENLRSVLGDAPALDYPILKSQLSLENWPALPELDLSAARDKITELSPKALRLVTISTAPFPELAQKLESELENLGLAVNLTIFEPTQDFVLNVLSARDYDLLLYEIDLGADPDLFAYYHSSGVGSSGLNLSNYSSVLTDDLILAARTNSNPKLRATKYEAFLKQWVNDAPALAISQTELSYYYHSGARVFSEDNTLIYPTDRFADLSTWSVQKSLRSRTP